jgi:hypothetical protein
MLYKALKHEDGSYGRLNPYPIRIVNTGEPQLLPMDIELDDLKKYFINDDKDKIIGWKIVTLQVTEIL